MFLTFTTVTVSAERTTTNCTHPLTLRQQGYSSLPVRLPVKSSAFFQVLQTMGCEQTAQTCKILLLVPCSFSK